jgi:hypothetical protein
MIKVHRRVGNIYTLFGDERPRGDIMSFQFNGCEASCQGSNGLGFIFAERNGSTLYQRSG